MADQQPGSYTFGRGRGRVPGGASSDAALQPQQTAYAHRGLALGESGGTGDMMSGRAAMAAQETAKGERMALAGRPDEGGKVGTTKKIKVNFFPVNVVPEAAVHLYSLVIQPTRWKEFSDTARPDAKGPAPLTLLEKQEILHQLRQLEGEPGFIKFNNPANLMVYDGNATLMTVNPIPEMARLLAEWRGPASGQPLPAFHFGEEPDEAAALDEDARGREVTLKRFTAKLSDSSRPMKFRATLRPITNPRHSGDPTTQLNLFSLSELGSPHSVLAKAEYRITPAHLLDAIFTQWCQNWESPQRDSWYCRRPSLALCNPYAPDTDANFKIPLPNGIECWYGLYFAARIGRVGGINRPFVNLDTAVGVMYTEQSFLNFCAQLLGGLPPNTPYPPKFTPAQAVTINRHAAGVKVQSTHVQRTYQIKAFRNDQTPNNTRFSLGEDGGEMSVAEYFLQKYKYRLQFPDMGMVEVRSGGKDRQQTTWIPLEVLEILKRQEAKSLPDQAASIMIKKLCTPAPERESRLMRLAEMARFGTDPWTSCFGLGILPQMHQLNSRVLPAPQIRYARAQTARVKEGVWDNAGMAEPKALEAQSVLIFAFSKLHPNIPRIAEEMWKNLRMAASKMGMNLAADIYNFNQNLSTDHDTIVKQICGTVSEARDAGKKIQHMMVIFKERSPQLYASVKYVGDHFLGITSQCLLLKTISPLKPMTAQNILLKMNVKLGGANWHLGWDKAPSDLLAFLKEPTLICGAEVSHPKPGDVRQPSIASVVGNTDRDLAKWNATIAVSKEPDLERVPFFRYAFEKRMFEYVKKSHKVPKHIILFRDGVSESQYEALMEQELAEVKSAIQHMFGQSPAGLPLLTFVVTIKRHHVRFFPSSRAEAVGRAQNVLPGTVVDSEVASPDEWDFWLMSHAGIQGTCRPTYYQVLHDELGLSSDQLQLLAYSLCHNYARCPRAVSYPQPVYYAFRAAERARYHLAAEHASGEDARGESTSSDSQSSRAQAGAGTASRYAPSATGASDAASSTLAGRSSSSSTSSSSSSSSVIEEAGVRTPEDIYRGVSLNLHRLQTAATVSPAIHRLDHLYFM